MNESVVKLADKIDGLALRERALILLCALAVVGLFLYSQLIDPLLQERAIVDRQSGTLGQKITEQDRARLLLDVEISAGVNRNKIRRRDQLRDELDALNEQIEQSVVAMIPPRRMAQVLESILAQDANITLLGIENRPVVALMKQDDSEGAEAIENQQTLYRHAFVLHLQGNYLAAIDYFERLEALPWRFYWHELSLSVDQYPSATIILTLHTVSMSEELLGV
ncbi:MAG: MSHA biogenesis protein MshJ [Paraglaciecola psychrophila]